MKRVLIGLCAMVVSVSAACADVFKDGETVCFLGDSITHAGRFHSFIYDYYLTRFPERKIHFINAGVSGDSAYWVQGRLTEDLVVKNPSSVFVMFGMNDIDRWNYAEPINDAKRKAQQASIAAFRTNMEKLIGRIRGEAGEPRLLLATPSPFDQTAFNERNNNAPGCNDALGACASMVRELAAKNNGTVVDFYTPMTAYNLERQKIDPNDTIIGPDRIHPGRPGSVLMAWIFLKAQGAPALVSKVTVDASARRVTTSDNATVTALDAKQGALSFTVLERALPFPIDAAAKPLLASFPIVQDLDQETLAVTGLPAGAYEVTIDGAVVGRYTAEELARGFNLATNDAAPQLKQAQAVARLNETRRSNEETLRGYAMVRANMRYNKVNPDDLDAVRTFAETKMNGKPGFVSNYLKDWPQRGELIAKVAATEQELFKARQPAAHAYVMRPAAAAQREPPRPTVAATPEQGPASAIGVRTGGSDPVLPAPAEGRNFIENPGFEGGMVSWGLAPWPLDHPDPSGRCGWRLVEGQAHSGRRCAEYTSVQDFHAPMLSPNPVVVQPGHTYTISFYVRSDTPGARLRFWTQSATWGVFPCSHDVGVGKEWKRFAFSFQAPTAYVRFGFGDHWAEVGHKPLFKVLLDDVQFEEGQAAGDFVQKPLYAWFDVTVSNGVAFTGQPAPVRLTVASSTDAMVRVEGRLTIRDVNGRLLDSQPLAFSLAPHAAYTNTIDAARLRTKGLLRLAAEVKTGAFADTFFGRLAICDDLAGRSLSLAYLCFRQGGPTLEEVGWLQRVGYRGSLGWTPPDPDAWRACASRGWRHIFTVAEGRDAPVNVFEQKMTEADWATYFAWLDARLKPYAGLPVCYKTMNEPDVPQRTWTPEEHVRVVKHIHDVVKASSPSALILTPDPWHCGREAQQWIDHFLAAGGKDVVDALAIHSYSARPEGPDFDANIQALKAIKARHGLQNIPILFTEGEGNPYYTDDALGMSPLKGFFEWRMGLLTLDVGPSETTGAAVMARRLLIALKNADDVKSYLTWTDDLDAFTRQPKASIGVVNQLLSLLGDATFVREETIGENTRTYLFTTPQKKPVAALWCHDLKVDRGETPAPLASLALPDAGWRLLDMMGNPLVTTQAHGRVEFPLGNQPVYLVGERLALDALQAALERSTIGGSGPKVVSMTVRLASPGQATVQVANRLVRPVAGTLLATVDGKTAATQEVSLKEKGTATVAVPLPGRRDALNQARVTLRFTERETGLAVSYADDLRWFAVPPLARTPGFGGNLADWEGASAFTLDAAPAVVNALAPWQGPQDCSVTWRFGYTRDGLCICAAVRDDAFVTATDIKNAWRGDSLQLYIDLRADGHDRPGLGYDSNDETLWAAKINGQDVLYRDYTPEWQLAFVKGGVITDGQIVVTRKEGVTLYEMRLPPTQVSPLALQPGTSFGCGLIVNDSDVAGVRKLALTNTKPGTEPHDHPEFWPFAVLTDK